MFNYTFCPVCSNTAIEKKFDCKDHSVSKETFPIFYCNQCTFLFTNPIPEENAIGPYYQSEEYISHTDSNKGIINKLYHTVRNITLNQKLNLINQYSSTKKILDIGCGTGYFLKKVKENGWETTGMEPDSQARNLAQENTKGNIYSQIQEIPNQNFPIITLWHVLEHIHQLKNGLEKIKELQNQGNTLIIALPNHKSWDAKHYKSYWAAYDVPRHLYHFNKKSVEQLLQQYNYELIKTKPMWFDSIYVSMLSEKYRNGSTILGIIKGFVSNLSGIFSKEYSSHIYIFRKK